MWNKFAGALLMKEEGSLAGSLRINWGGPG